MITLPNPITIATSAVTLSTLPLILLDDPQKRITQVSFKSFRGRLTIWSGENYKPVGTYTQEDVEAAVTALLGSDPAVSLSKLATKSTTPVTTPATAVPTATSAPIPPATTPAAPPTPAAA